MSRLLAAAALMLCLNAAHAAAAEEAVATAGAAEAPKAATGDTAAQIEDFIRRAPPPSLDDGTPDGGQASGSVEKRNTSMPTVISPG